MQSRDYPLVGPEWAPSPDEPPRRPQRWLGFAGAGTLIAVGYMDPGNWATAIAGAPVTATRSCPSCCSRA